MEGMQRWINRRIWGEEREQIKGWRRERRWKLREREKDGREGRKYTKIVKIL